MWIDLLRGLAVVFMIEVHVTNVWYQGPVPAWLNFINGLVAPSFLLCAGFGMVLSTFENNTSLRSFKDVLPRYGFILLCAYMLHAPGFALAQWTVLNTPQLMRELFKIDVLQCVIYSLLILQTLARTIRNRTFFCWVALALGISISILSPYLWVTGIGENLSMPLRGLLNGVPDRGVTALFPLFPWFCFIAFGAALGGVYASARTEERLGRSKISEAQFMLGLAIFGLMIWFWGQSQKDAWLWSGTWTTSPDGLERLNGWTREELYRLHNQTLPSILERLGIVMMLGSLLGTLKHYIASTWLFNLLDTVSRESLLIYLLHLQIIFGLLLYPKVIAVTGWDWYTQGTVMTLVLIGVIITLSLGIGIVWQRIRKDALRMHQLQRQGVFILLVWFLVGHWWTYLYYLKSPELAIEPYSFLNMARIRKGLNPTRDGRCIDPEEFLKESTRRGITYPPSVLKKKLDSIADRSIPL